MTTFVQGVRELSGSWKEWNAPFSNKKTQFFSVTGYQNRMWTKASGSLHPEDGGSQVLRNVSIIQQHHASQLKRPQLEVARTSKAWLFL